MERKGTAPSNAHLVSTWWQFCYLAEMLKAPTNVFQTHVTSIEANNGSHKTHFNNMVRGVLRIRLSYYVMLERFQEMLLQFLRLVGETRAITAMVSCK